MYQDDSKNLHNNLLAFVQQGFVDGLTIKRFLENNPHLLSKEAKQTLGFWHRKLTELGNEAEANDVREKLLLLENLWLIGVEVPIALGTKYQAGLAILNVLQQQGVGSAKELAQRIETRPGSRQLISHAALTNIPESDWAIVVLLTAFQAGNYDLYYIVEEFPILIERESLRKIQVLKSWAVGEEKAQFLETLEEVGNRISGLRRDINSGKLKLRNPELRRLVHKYYYSDSWSQAKLVIEENEDLLLSPEGIHEMVLLATSAFATWLVGRFNPSEGQINPREVGAVMMHLNVLEICQLVGIDKAFSRGFLPELPVELWTVGGFLYSGDPSIRTWGGFKKLLEINSDELDGKKELLSPLLRSMQEDSTDEKSLFETKESPLEGVSQLEFLSRLSLAFFALSDVGDNLCSYLINESRLFDRKMAACLKLIRHLGGEDDDREYTVEQAILGLESWLSSKDRDAFIKALNAVETSKLREIAPSGASLAALVGGILIVIDQDSELDGLRAIESFPALTKLDSVALTNMLSQELKRNNELALSEAITEVSELLRSSKELGTFARRMSVIGKEVGVPEVAQAIMVWGAVNTPEDIPAAVRQHPLLLSDAVLDKIERFIDDAAQMPERIEEFADPAEIRQWMKEKYAALLLLRRDAAESEQGFTRRFPDTFGNSKHAGQLIAVLENRIPAKLWFPVSRVDLTDEFFAIAASWQEQIEEWGGHEYGRYLRRVVEQTIAWRDMFGEISPDHTLFLSTTLLSLIGAFDRNDLAGAISFVDEHPQILKFASLDILQDWITVAVSLEESDTAARLEHVVEYLEYAIEFDPKLAAFAVSTADKKDAWASFAAEFLGLSDVSSFAEVVQTVLELSPQDSIEFLQKMEGLINKGTDLDTLAQRRSVRLLTLKTELLTAIESQDTKRISELMLSEPLMTEPEMVKFLEESVGLPEEVIGKLIEGASVLELSANDPLLKKDFAGEKLTDSEEQELLEVVAHIGAVIVVKDWTLRLMLIRSSQETLLSDRAWALLHTYKNTLLNQTTELIKDRSLAEIYFEEVRSFILKCRETSFEHARAELLEKLWGPDRIPGDVDITLAGDHLDLMAKLPFDVIDELADESLPYLESAAKWLEVDRTHDLSDTDRASLFHNLATIYQAEYENTESREGLDKAIEAYEMAVVLTTSDANRKALRLVRLATALRKRFDVFGHRKEDLDDAITMFHEAIVMPGIADLMQGEIFGHLGEALTSRFESFGRIKDIEEAIDLLNRAIGLTPVGTQDWLGWHINLGVAWSTVADQLDDPEAYKKALEIYKRGFEKAPEGTTVWWTLKANTLSVKVSLGQLDEAIKDLQDMPSAPYQIIERQSGLSLNLGSALNQRFLDTGNISDLDMAIDQFEKGLSQADYGTPDWIRFSGNLATALRDRSGFMRNTSDYERSLDLYSQILGSSAVVNWPNLVHGIAERLGNHFARQGRYEDSIYPYSKAVETLDLMWRSTNLTDERIFYSEENEALYARLVYSCLMSGNIELAFDFASRAKGRAFSDSLVSRDINVVDQDPEVLSLLNELEILDLRLRHLRGVFTQEIKPPGQISIDGTPRPIDFGEVLADIRSTEARSRATSSEINYRYPQYKNLASAQPLSARRARALARYLDATLLDFFQDIGGWGVFVVNRSEIKHVRLAHVDPPWGAWFASLLDGDTISPTSEFNDVLAEIYHFFISPLEPFLPSEETRVVIATTGLLGMFPIGAAISPQGQHFLEKYILTLTPSLPVSAQLVSQSTMQEPTNMLLVAYPGAEGSRHYLKHVGSEAAAVRSIVKETKHLHGNDASPEMVLKFAKDCSIVHFACHGVFDWHSPDSTGLMLSEGGWLTVPTIMNRLRLERNPLVVLAACEQGLEHVRDGDEHASLSRAFIHAGASSVISSLWPVDDRSTSLLMERFYWLHIKEGLTAANALREAQIWIKQVTRRKLAAHYKSQDGFDPFDLIKGYADNMRGDPDAQPYIHPFYWAGFTYTGL